LRFFPIGGNPSGSNPYSARFTPAYAYISFFYGLNILNVDLDEPDP